MMCQLRNPNGFPMPDLEAVVARATRIVVGAEGPHVDPSRTDTTGSTSRHRIRSDREAVGRIRSGAVETVVFVRLVVARPPTPLRLYYSVVTWLYRCYDIVPILKYLVP